MAAKIFVDTFTYPTDELALSYTPASLGESRFAATLHAIESKRPSPVGLAVSAECDGTLGTPYFSCHGNDPTWWRAVIPLERLRDPSTMRRCFIEWSRLHRSTVAWTYTSSSEPENPFLSLGWAPPASSDQFGPQGYGWLNLWPSAVHDQVDPAMSELAASAGISIDPTPSGAGWVVETANGPIPTADQLDMLAAMLENVRTPRWRRVSSDGLTPAAVASLSRREALLSVPPCDRSFGPDWPHPDWPIRGLRVDARFNRAMIDARKEQSEGPAHLPDVDWWERPEPERLPHSAETK
ncbi:MAG: hypothetical protein AAGC53_15670 [Actinomycetota bacterium]